MSGITVSNDIEIILGFYNSTAEEDPMPWKDILLLLKRNADNPDIYNPLLKCEYGRTLLHVHFQHSRLSGQNEDELEIARYIIQQSISEEGESVLTESDRLEKTPLHYLFGGQYRPDIVYDEYIDIISEMVDKVELLRKHAIDTYWNEVFSEQNDWGRTVLHCLAENRVISLKCVQTIIKRCNNCCAQDSYDMVHPLLTHDVDFELPFHDICISASETEEEDFLSIYLGIVEPHVYKETYEPIFDPVTSFNILDEYLSDNAGEFSLFCDGHEWWSAENEIVSLQQFLTSRERNEQVNFDGLFDPLLKKLGFILSTASICVSHRSSLDLYKNISSMLLHKACLFDNFPAFYVQLIYWNDISATITRDEYGRIPLHYALIGADIEKDRRTDKMFDDDVSLFHWKSRFELRSLVEYLIEYEPKGATFEDAEGRLPLHLAIIHSANYRRVIKPVIDAYPIAITMKDPVTNLLPFMVAAYSDKKLDVIYELLKSDPTVVEIADYRKSNITM